MYFEALQDFWNEQKGENNDQIYHLWWYGNALHHGMLLKLTLTIIQD